ncbi:MAG TPA: hypothetical protein PLP22_07900 [Candidatus Competibacter sp.]|nr:hypothetical protein [Candidatus Competibacteraceae bacterium]HRE54698.1 hypothetical protein [Candidatus Competibacter sp.]HUM93296.1 hypothetical protein [Candidatus Competibacter sp.]
MMNTQQAMIDAVKKKLEQTDHGKSVMDRVSEIKRLQCDLAALGPVSEQDAPLRLPYSSMPHLNERCWK